jgi:hypothetical protein
MPSATAMPQGSCEALRGTVRPHRALWLLVATGCGMQTPLEAPGADPSAGTGGSGGSGLTTSGMINSGGGAGTSGGNAVSVGGAGGGANTPPSGGCTMDAQYPGYLHCGPWNGYAWTLATEPDLGSSISPPDFSMATALPLCASGVLARVDSAVGLLGFYVNQSVDANTPGSPGTWGVTGKGIKYELSNPGGSPLRIQIQGARGYPDETWCADISGSITGVVPWSTFNKECWFNFPSEAYDGQTPIEQVMLLVPGANGIEQPFEVCLIGLTPS